MGVKIEKADGEVRAFLDGEIDHHCAPSIRNEIDLAVESCRPENLILDFGGHGADGYYLLEQLLGGGLMLGAWFMATDYVTTPITKRGQLVYGVILGCLTGLFRIFGASAEGVSYAIIFGNLLIPVIERLTVPTAFGKGGVKHEK